MLVSSRLKAPGRSAAGFDLRLAKNRQNKSDEILREGLMISIPRRKLLVGMTAATTLFAAPAIIRAQAKALKIGVLLPRSGYMAPTGQGSHRGATIAPEGACRLWPSRRTHAYRHRKQCRRGQDRGSARHQRRRPVHCRKRRFRGHVCRRTGLRATWGASRGQCRRRAANYRTRIQIRRSQFSRMPAC